MTNGKKIAIEINPTKTGKKTIFLMMANLLNFTTFLAFLSEISGVISGKDTIYVANKDELTQNTDTPTNNIIRVNHSTFSNTPTAIPLLDTILYIAIPISAGMSCKHITN